MTVTLDAFLSASLIDRFRMAVDETNRSMLTDYFGEAGYTEYRQLAEEGLRVVQQQSLAPGTPPTVVFVPGIMGSRLVDGESNNLYWLTSTNPWRAGRLGLDASGLQDAAEDLRVRADGLLTFYDPFLAPQVWEPRRLNHVTHAFDWRKSLRSQAPALHDQIVDLFAQNGERPINLIGHSMGGVLIRVALHLFGAELWPKIGKIALVGVPNYGSPKLAGYLKFHFWGAELPIGLLAYFIDRPMFRSFWGAVGLLPAPTGIYPGTWANDPSPWTEFTDESYPHPCANFDFYRAENWALNLTADETNQLQRLLDEAAALYRDLDVSHRALRYDKRERILSIVGVGQPMPYRIIAPSKDAGNGDFTRLEAGLPQDAHLDGDGSVTIASAVLDRVKTHYIRGNHGKLPMLPAVQRAIFDWFSERTVQLPETPEEAYAVQLSGETTVPYPALADGAGGQVTLPGADGVEPDAATIADVRERILRGEIVLPSGFALIGPLT